MLANSVKLEEKHVNRNGDVKEIDAATSPHQAAGPAGSVPTTTLQLVQMQCPQGSTAGDTLVATINGATMSVIVPNGVLAGEYFQVQVPLAPTTTAVATVAAPQP